MLVDCLIQLLGEDYASLLGNISNWYNLRDTISPLREVDCVCVCVCMHKCKYSKTGRIYTKMLVMVFSGQYD